MFTALKDLLTSKKFILTVSGSAVCAALSYVGAPPELIAIVGGLFGVNVVGQGMADFRKNQKN